MINKKGLEEILNEYGINLQELLKLNENILEKGEPKKIREILKYLVNILEIEPKNIEKCPSILYFGEINDIKANWDFLKSNKINIDEVETCLHILSTQHKELRKTYEFVEQNYGIEVLDDNTSILRIEVDRIQGIEERFKDILSNKAIVQAAISLKSLLELKKIIEICKENGIMQKELYLKETQKK